MKNKLLIIVVSFVVIITMFSGIYAYFTFETTTRGVITSDSLKLEVHQESLLGEELDNNDFKVMPGDIVDRIVTVENVGNQPLYLRVKIVTTVDDEDLSATDCLRVNINSNYWIYEDGYYYYYKTLDSGIETEALFTEVYIDGENVDNKYLGKSFKLDVVAQATQRKNNSDNVLEAFGWPQD